MKIKTLLFTLLFLVGQSYFWSINIANDPEKQKIAEQDAAILRIETFYKTYMVYILELFPSLLPEERWPKLEALQEAYLTKRMIDRVNDMEYDYNFVIGFDDRVNWGKSLKVFRKKSADNAYEVCYFRNSDNRDICTTVIVVKQNGKYMIDDILDPYIEKMIQYKKQGQ